MLEIEIDGRVGLFASSKFKKVSARKSPVPILVDMGETHGGPVGGGFLSSIEEHKERSEERSV